jgi:hypothetical protein
MAADETSDLEKKPLEPSNGQPAAPATYRVAREAAGVDNVNTIDIFGERPFSV